MTALAPGAVRAVPTVRHTFAAPAGAQRFAARARLTRRDGTVVQRRLPALDPHTVESVDIIVSPPQRWASLGGILTAPVTALRHPDGRIEVFGLGTDRQLWHLWQTAPSNGWSGWASMPGDPKSGRAMPVINGEGRMELFMRQANSGEAQHIWLQPTGGWSPWAGLGGVVVGDPCAITNSDGRLEVHVRGSDAALWNKWQQVSPGGPWCPYLGNWNNLAAPPGRISSALSAARNADGRIEIFARAGDGQLWSRCQDSPGGNWGAGWNLIAPTGFTGDPVAIANSDGRLEVFARGTAGDLVHVWQTAVNNGWSGAWTSRGGSVRDGVRPGVIRNERTGQLEVFTLGTDGHVHHIPQIPAAPRWGAWEDLSGPLGSEVAVSQNADGRLEIFALGTDGSLYHRWEISPGGGWN